MALFPVPARQTGRADFPHPAFSQPQTFALGRSARRSLSLRRHGTDPPPCHNRMPVPHYLVFILFIFKYLPIILQVTIPFSNTYINCQKTALCFQTLAGNMGRNTEGRV
jgi:hypothetical protein